MDDLNFILIVLFSLIIAMVVSAILIINKSRKKAEQSEANITKMVNSLPQEKQMQFIMQVNSVKKNPTTAVLLALFLGGLGAHKFYLGKTGMGIVYLIFSWTTLPAWISIIEAFSLSRQVAQVNEKKAQEYFHMYSNTY